jgi:hypothetical protein
LILHIPIGLKIDLGCPAAVQRPQSAAQRCRYF